MSIGKQFRRSSQELKEIGLRLNSFLYVDGNLKEGQKQRIDDSEYTVEELLEDIRRLVWWVYNFNKESGEQFGVNI